MSTPPEPGAVPAFDPAHPSVGTVPAWLMTGKHQGPQGDLLILTVRVPNATVTAVMTKVDAQNWIRQIQKEVDGLSSLVVAPPGAQMPPMNGLPRPGM
jgi:hypothetical protein